MTKLKINDGRPEPMGMSLDADGANVAVFSEHAEAIVLCLFDGAGHETDRIALPARTGAVHHGHIAGIRAGQRYGLRAEGPYDPANGHRFNPAKLLLDPYARALTGPVSHDPRLAGGDETAPDPTDTAGILPHCVAIHEQPAIDPAERPTTPWSDTVIYEAHVKGMTRLWPGLGAERGGTVEALADPGVIAHLHDLGITALELLPVHAFTTERHLAGRGLTNYWGYNTTSFFAPEPRYLGPGGLAGLRRAVRTLHEAGIEVILDVVYNHTGESDGGGPTLSFRGLDNLSYYQRDPAAHDGYVNHTGCGNTVNLAHPAVLRLVLDSLRWWATRIGVDGFRFDLAPSLTRGADGAQDGAPFLAAMLQDPVLRELKLIVEPWDIGPDGYRLGAFPAPIAEWNDRARDTARALWLGRPGGPGDAADLLLGSAQTFDRAGRPPYSSVNFVACHDGFTLADLTLYSRRHNEANGEGNRDGHGENLSDNLGYEGPGGDPAIAAARARRRRALMATVLLAQGTPMLLAGDEIGHSQGGNNNAYCQDNETTWIDWASGDRDLLAFARRLIALRGAVPALRQTRWLHGEVRDDGLANVAWSGLDGDAPDWDTAHETGVAVLKRGHDAEHASETWALIALNPGPAPRDLALPDAPGRRWRRALDTDLAGADDPGAGADPIVAAGALAVWLAEPDASPNTGDTP